MSGTLVKQRLDTLERRGGGGGSCWCVHNEPLNGEPEPPLLCPHGRPWAIQVIYDDPPLPGEEIAPDA